MESDLSNGFAFMTVKELRNGEWVVRDSRFRGRILPSLAFAKRLRRQTLQYWAAALVGSALVLVGTWNFALWGVVISLACLGIGLNLGRQIRQLPRSDYRFTRKEFLYQGRGPVASSGLLCLGLAVPMGYLDHGFRVALILAAFAVVAVLWWARKPGV